MKKIIFIFSLSLIFVAGTFFTQIEDADARGHYGQKNKVKRAVKRHHKRKVKRAYVAGAVRGSRRAEHRHERHERHERRERREDRRDLARGAIAVGVGAAIVKGIHDNNERREERYREDQSNY